MQSDPSLFFPPKPKLPFAEQVGYYTAPMASVLNEKIMPPNTKPFKFPFLDVDIQPSEACPVNFIIFDRTNSRSHIMFNPKITSRFGESIFQEDINLKALNEGTKVASRKEDSADIDALLSTEYENSEECDDDDDDVVSTARTNAIHESDSSDSCSNYKLLSKGRSFFNKSKDMKRRKMRKMVNALKGIVPGANRMSTMDVLNEAVQYLRSLRSDVQKLGV